MIECAADDRLLIIAPHPDDESLAAGGLIQRALKAGAAVRVVFLTSGDNNPWPQRFVERRLRIGANDRVRWAERRRREAIAALAVLGVDDGSIRFLGLPDQGITRLLMQGGEAIVAALVEEGTGILPAYFGCWALRS
jgi:LmbE family N-acetylglucosaminyl deacetylase